MSTLEEMGIPNTPYQPRREAYPEQYEHMNFEVTDYRGINGDKYWQVTASCKCGRGGFVRIMHTKPKSKHIQIQYKPCMETIHVWGTHYLDKLPIIVRERLKSDERR